DVVLSEDPAGRIVGSVLEKATRTARVDAQGRYPSKLWAELGRAAGQGGHGGHAGQDDVVVHEGQARARQTFQQLQAAARERALAVAVELILAAHAAVLGQTQHRHDVDALDGRLIARIDDE